jgi:hypothetical protein
VVRRKTSTTIRKHLIIKDEATRLKTPVIGAIQRDSKKHKRKNIKICTRRVRMHYYAVNKWHLETSISFLGNPFKKMVWRITK